MRFLVFLRGVNVGGRTLHTAALAKELETLDVVSIGAAGTYAVRSGAAASAVRAAFVDRIPFPTEVMVVPVTAAEKILGQRPFGPGPRPAGERWAVTVVAGLTDPPPPLPLVRPANGPWEVRLESFAPPFVLSRSRRLSPTRILYPNVVVEKEFRRPATTRWWETLEDVVAAARASDTAPSAARTRTKRSPDPRGTGR